MVGVRARRRARMSRDNLRRDSTMRRSVPPTSLRRAAESDSSFLLTGGLVFVILLFLAAGGGLLLWELQRVNLERQQAMEEMLAAAQASEERAIRMEYVARIQAAQAQW